MTISEIQAELEKVKMDHGDVEARMFFALDGKPVDLPIAQVISAQKDGQFSALLSAFEWPKEEATEEFKASCS